MSSAAISRAGGEHRRLSFDIARRVRTNGTYGLPDVTAFNGGSEQQCRDRDEHEPGLQCQTGQDAEQTRTGDVCLVELLIRNQGAVLSVEGV